MMKIQVMTAGLRRNSSDWRPQTATGLAHLARAKAVRPPTGASRIVKTSAPCHAGELPDGKLRFNPSEGARHPGR
jgi:hypothetical protein